MLWISSQVLPYSDISVTEEERVGQGGGSCASTYSDSTLIGPLPFGTVERLTYISPSKLMPLTLNHVYIVCRSKSNKVS